MSFKAIDVVKHEHNSMLRCIERGQKRVHEGLKPLSTTYDLLALDLKDAAEKAKSVAEELRKAGL